MSEGTAVFLGETYFMKPAQGFQVAFNGYSGNAAFEEWHSHENPSFSLLLSGTYEEELHLKHYKRVPGDLKFVPENEVHRCSHYVQGTRKINLELSREWLQQMEVSQQQLDLLTTQAMPTKFNLLKVFHEMQDPGEQSKASAELLLYGWLQGQHALQKTAVRNPPAWVGLLKEYLHDQWDSKFVLEVIAREAGIHPVSLSKYFPKYFSATLGNYINQIKIDKSLSLIRTSSGSLTDIAYRCGFADQAHFTRTFKAVTGYLPKDFRKI